MGKKNNWNKLLSILGFIVLLISLVALWSTFEKKKIDEEQIKVEAKIIEAPEDCSVITTRGGYCKLEYNGKIHVKRAGNRFCHLVSGKEEVIVLRNKDGSKLLFIGEYDPSQYGYIAFMIIISIVIIIKGYRK